MIMKANPLPSLAALAALALLPAFPLRAQELLLQDSFALGNRPSDERGTILNAADKTEINDFWALFPNQAAERWISGRKKGGGWDFASAPLNPNEPLADSPGGVNGVISTQGENAALLPFIPPSTAFEAAADLVVSDPGDWIALGFTSSPAVANNFESFGQIWLRLFGDGSWQVFAQGAQGPSASGRTALAPFNPVRLAYDPVSKKVSGSVNGAEFPPFSLGFTPVISDVGFEANSKNQVAADHFRVTGASSGPGQPSDDIIILPEQQTVIASTYYAVIDASPLRLLDNSGLSSPLNTGDPVPAVYPAHDTNLANMYWSGSEHTPIVTFSLPETFDLRGLHYWNFNEPSSPGNDGTGRGFKNVAIYYSADAVAGAYTLLGTFQFQEASGTIDYRGATLSFGQTIRAHYLRLAVLGDWGGDFAGMSEVRFLGSAIPSLQALPSASGVTLSWPVAPGYVLQASSDLANPAAWTPVSSPNSGGPNTVTVPTDSPFQFFRLAKP